MKHLMVEAHYGEPLAAQLVRALSPAVGRVVEPAEVEQLLAQGSVFRNKVRYRDPGPPEAGPFEVFWPDLPVTEFTLDPHRVVWEDEHLLVVNKPPGVNAAPSPFSDRDCLTWGVETYLGGLVPIHAVHRLDRDTGGLMLFAKTKDAERSLHQMFRFRQIRKVYWALTPEPAEPILRGSVFRWRDVLDWRGHEQAAATTALFEGTSGGRGCWAVLPHTGRPHQIRKHFARYLVPLWGDRVYAPGVYGPGEVLGLTCVAYRFRHPITCELLLVQLSHG